MTYEQLQKANATITTTLIKSKEGTKEYAAVNERIKVFRMLYPDGFIITELVSDQNGICIIKAKVGYYNEDGESRILGTGTAYEKEGSTFINKTSYIENAETSAVGRALGMLGIGIDTSVASAEEVSNEIAQQENDTLPATAEQVKEIKAFYPEPSWSEVAAYFGKQKLEDLTKEEANRVLAKARKRK